MTSPPRDGDDEVVRFARLVAHGLRNPLAIATGMLDLLARQVGDDLDEESLQLVERSSAALHRASDLVLSLHRYTTATRATLEPGRVDLGSVLDAAAAEVDLEDTVVLPGELPAITADERAVQRVLRELLDNAARAGATTVTVSALVDDGGATIVVDDDGPGIDAAQRETAFTEGERLGRLGDGFGLGLPTVRALARRHGGEAHLEASPAGGLRAVVRLGSLGEQGP